MVTVQEYRYVFNTSDPKPNKTVAEAVLEAYIESTLSNMYLAVEEGLITEKRYRKMKNEFLEELETRFGSI